MVLVLVIVRTNVAHTVTPTGLRAVRACAARNTRAIGAARVARNAATIMGE